MADPVTNLPLDAIIKSTPLDGVQQAFRVDSVDRVDNRSVDVAVATGAPVDVTIEKTSAGDNTPIVEAKSATGDVVAQAIDTSIKTNLPPEEAADVVLGTQEKRSAMDRASDFWLESALTVDNPDYNPRLARSVQNQQIAFEVMAERFKGAQEQGTTATVLDFLDRYLLRQIGIGTYEDITRRSERKGLELAQAAADMDSDEYREFISAYADELAEEGVFRGENWFAYQDGVNEALNAGIDLNAGFNQIMGFTDLLGAPALAKGTLKTGKVFGRVASLKGIKGADEAFERLSEAGARNHPEVLDESLPASNSLTKDVDNLAPTQGKVNGVATGNKLIADIQELYKAGTFGRMATPEQIAAASGEIVAKLKKISSRPIASQDVVDVTGLGDLAVNLRVGKVGNGDPFQGTAGGLKSAQKAAVRMQDNGLAAEVVKVDPTDVSKGYYIQLQERLDVSTASSAVDVANISENMLKRALGSTRATDDLRLNTLANMSESGQGAIRERVMPYLKPLETLKYDSKIAIGQVFRELRDGEDAFIREGYTEGEFRSKFKKYHPKGKEATEADVDAFYAAKTINDTAYYLQANRIASRYVRQGYKTIRINAADIPAKVIDDLADDAVVLDAKLGTTFSKSEFPEGTTFWKLDRELEGGIDVVAKPKNVRSIQYEDVLGYNAGGRRLNPTAKYFVTTGTGRGRALLASVTEAQAKLAVKQIDTLFSAIRATGRGLDGLTNELDEIIPELNDWNPSIVDTQDLKELIAKKGWDVDQPVSFKQRDGVVEDPTSELYNGMTMGDYVRTTHSRSDDVLMEYGGTELVNDNPVKAMVDQLAEATAEYSFRNYNYNAKTAWLKKALRTDKLPEGTDVNALFRKTEANGSGATDRKLRQLRGIIERRESMKGPVEQAMADLGGAVQEFVFDKTGRKLPTGGAEGLLLNMGFRSAFGFMNVSQLWLQASHAINIVAISPQAGSTVMRHAMGFRMAANSGDEAAKALGFQRLAKASGIDAKEWADLDKYIRTSGRDLVENDAIEKGTGSGWGVSWWEGSDLRPSTMRKAISGTAGVVKKADEIGLKPFNAGERISRHTAIMTAFVEHRAKFPNVSALSDEGRAWITRREQDLSFNMTTASRGAWQAGIMKVPTQWLSYSMRSLEAVVIGGGGLNAGERARLGIMMTLLGGTSGVAMGGVADYVGEKFGVAPDSPAYAGLKYGMIDAMLSYSLSAASGENIRTALGTRIAPFTAFTDLYRKVTEESTLTALGGPSGEIVGGAATAGLNALMGGWDLIVNGGGYGPETFKKDMARVLRTPSGIDNIWKATEMMRTGVYRSKTGTTLDFEFSDAEAALQALGMTNFKVAEFYDRKGKLWREAKELGAFQRQISNDFQLSLAKYRDDPQAGRALMDEIAARIEFSGFSPIEKGKLRRNLSRDNGNDVLKMSMELITKGSDYGARVIESLNQE